MLNFRNSRSQIFFNVGVLKILQYSRKNTCAALAALLLQNTYGGCFWICVAANTFFQLNPVFIADRRTGISSELLWKQELNLWSSHWNSLVKKGVVRNFANFIGKHLCVLFNRVGTLSFFQVVLSPGLPFLINYTSSSS